MHATFANLPTKMPAPFFRPAPMNKRRTETETKKRVRETKTGRFTFVLEPSLLKDFTEYAESLNEDASETARRAIRHEIDGKFSGSQDDEDHSARLPIFYNAPGGPWAEITAGEHFTLNTQTADWLEVQDGDALFQIDGESMLAAGIPHGSLVLMRPYGNKRPQRGDIVFVQYMDEHETWKATVKRLDGWDGPCPRLLNGKDEPYPIPDGAESVVVVGKAIGQIGSLL